MASPMFYQACANLTVLGTSVASIPFIANHYEFFGILAYGFAHYLALSESAIQSRTQQTLSNLEKMINDSKK